MKKKKKTAHTQTNKQRTVKDEQDKLVNGMHLFLSNNYMCFIPRF